MPTGDFITLGELQTAYPALDDGQLADAPACISAASSEVALRYPKVAPRATYDETHDPGASRTVTLRRRPVLSVRRVRADMSRVLTLTYSGTGRRATAEVVNSAEAAGPVAANVTLSVELAGVAQTPAVVDFATFPTLADVGTHVGTLPGWSAAVATGQADMAAADLEPTQGAKSAKGGGAGLWAYATDLDDFHLTDPLNGELLLYRWRGQSYSYPGSTWGADPRSTAVRVAYDAGVLAVTPDVKRAVVLIVGALLESTEKGHVVRAQSSDDSGWRLANPTYRFPDEAERILSRYKTRRAV